MLSTTLESPVAPVEHDHIDGPPEFENTFGFDRFRSTLPKDAHYQSLRNAGRMNAAYVSEDEYQKHLAERAKLIGKKFDSGLTPAEAARLEYIRWSLDRIEDARHGMTLDRIEEAVARYKGALRDLQSLRTTLESHLPKGRR